MTNLNELFNMIDKYNENEVIEGKDPNDNTFSELNKVRKTPLTDKERKFARKDFDEFKTNLKG